MEQIIIKYLEKYGFIDLENKKLLENEIKNNNDVNPELILDLLRNCFLNKKYLMSLSKQIYKGFIVEDDENILKLFRKLFVIKRHHLKIKILYYLNLWKMYTNNKKSFLTMRNLKNISLKTISPCRKSKNSSRSLTPKNEEIDYKQLECSKNFNQFKNEDQSINSNTKNSNKTLKKSKEKIVSRHKYHEEIKGQSKLFGSNKKCENHFSKLYEEKFKRDKKLEENQLIKERQEVEKCTFRPRLLKTSKSQSYLKGLKSNFFETMNYKLNEKESKIKRMNEEKEILINNSCTFEPSINKVYITKTNTMRFLDRMTYFNERRNKKINQLSQEFDLKNDIKMSNRNLKRNNSFSHSSFKERVTLDTTERQKKMQKLEEDLTKERGITFKPKLNEEKLKAINSNFQERNKQFVENKSVKIKSAVSQNEIECTFSPKINENSNNIILKKEESLEFTPNIYNLRNPRSSSTSTFERLQNYNKIYQQNREELKENYKETYSFKPKISKNTEMILKNRQDYLKLINKNIEKTVKKLSPEKHSKEKIEEIRKDMIMEKFNNTCKETNYSNKFTLRKHLTNDLKENNDPIKSNTLKMESKNNLSNEFKFIEKNQNLKKDKNNLQEFKQSTMMNTHFLERLSDNQLLDLANNYITTDESLDQFKKAGKTNEKNQKINQNTWKEIQQNDMKTASQSFKKISQKLLNVNNKEYTLPKNIEKAIEYYNILKS